MRISFVIFSLAAFDLASLSAFVPAARVSLENLQRNHVIISVVANDQTGESEAEALLRKARELRAQAEQAEQQVHDKLVKKKDDKNAQTDALIDELFTGSSGLVDRLRRKRLSMVTLEAIADRLDEREVIAQGVDRVETKTGEKKTEFHRIRAPKDEEEVQRLQTLLEEFLQATAVLDEEFLQTKQEKGEKYVAHAEEEHWGGGKCAERLESRLKESRRERSEQFQERQEEFREAQRRKEGQIYTETQEDTWES